MSLFEKSLDELLALENDPALQFKEFTTETAWELGCYAREQAIKKYPDSALVIDIALNSDHTLFHTTTKAGTSRDNDQWVERKKRTVRRYGFSSFFVGQKIDRKGKTPEQALFISSIDYATHGGCIPLKLKNFDNVFGTLTISGLTQDLDHLFALELVKEFNLK